MSMVQTSNPAFKAIVEEAESIGWPKHYSDDLYVHDRDAIEEHKPTVFGWSLRETGTHIMFPKSDYGLFLAKYIATGSGQTSREYWWDGSKLTEVTPEQLVGKLQKLLGKSNPW